MKIGDIVTLHINVRTSGVNGGWKPGTMKGRIVKLNPKTADVEVWDNYRKVWFGPWKKQPIDRLEPVTTGDTNDVPVRPATEEESIETLEEPEIKEGLELNGMAY